MTQSRKRLIAGGSATIGLLLAATITQGPSSASGGLPMAVLVSAETLSVDGDVAVEYFVDAEQVDRFVQRDLGNKQLEQDWVYGDPRRALFNGGEPSVTHGVQEANTSVDVGLEDQIGWMYWAVETWEGEPCSDLGLVETEISSTFPGVAYTFFQGGGIQLIQEADLTQMGFFTPAEFPYFAANPTTLGVAFTLSWTDADGNLTDIDDNGKADVAGREIYYNDAFEWVDDGVRGDRTSGLFDFPSTALHEVGHGLSQAHFGNVVLRDDGSVSATPTAVMNAFYGGIQRELTGTDVGGHCSNWANWPTR